MQVAARRSLRLASKNPARFVAGCRRPSQRFARSFHTFSPRPISLFPWGNSPVSPKPDDSGLHQWNHEKQAWEPSTSIEGIPLPTVVPEGAGEPAADNGSNGNGDKDKNAHYGSALRRSMRKKKPKEVPAIPIPLNFLSWNVRRHKFDGPLTKGVLHLTGKEEAGSHDQTNPIGAEAIGDTKSSSPKPSLVVDPHKGADLSASQDASGFITSETSTSAARDAILVKFYASLQECSLAYTQMEETYGPPGDELENWDRLPDKWSEMPNLATKYERLAAEFEDVATEAFTAFPDGELARKVSSEPELGKDFAKHVNDLETALRDVPQIIDGVAYPPTSNPASQAGTQSTEYFPQYSLNHAMFSEVLTSIAAGLSLQGTANPDSFISQKTHLKILCPVDGGIYFLDKVVEEAATKLGADVTVLDPQDLVEMAGKYIREADDASGNALWSLGFDAAQAYNSSASSGQAEEEAEGEEGSEEDMDREHGFSPKIGAVTAIPLSAAPREMQNAIKRFFNRSRDMPFPPPMGPQNPHDGGNSFSFQLQPPKSSSAQNNESKLAALLDTIVNANVHKRDFLAAERGKILRSFQLVYAEQGIRAGSPKLTGSTPILSEPKLDEPGPSVIPLQGIQDGADQKASANTRKLAPKTIILIKDFKEMRSTPQGAKVVDKLVDIVAKRRQDGQQIMIVGTSATSDLAVTPSQSDRHTMENLQNEDSSSVFRTLIITPDTHRGLYYQEERRRLREINTRHLSEVVNRLDQVRPGEDDKKHGIRPFMVQLQQELVATPHSAYLEEQILSFDEVHRIVFTAVGQRNLDPDLDSSTRVKPRHIASALNLIKKSDRAKSNWAEEEYQIQNPAVDPDRKENPSSESRLKKLRKTCSAREKALLRGVVNPENIQTTFSDVHAPPETIEALENLTTLSLTRPDAFKYGVLAKDKLSGLLLYGPPGTGKTLLAKAVAKQSGATMLEVSGSDVYDMYVGEGEKNVAAVFSLAKKLAPCVIFIDEADAIFGSRGPNTGQRASHRELINQFLREWDGMNETSAFLMVATNRPFDIDDAALRRLPRRILIDLPSEKDREAILAIHLKEEAVEESVSLATLASQTPLYSGSDLKNLAVAAALAAVREENEAAAKHTGTEPHKFPEKRILSTRHFDKAMEEISASVNEDMSSLGAIRKFDEKYGDRRGRKKKATYGFSSDGVAREETAKVRT